MRLALCLALLAAPAWADSPVTVTPVIATTTTSAGQPLAPPAAPQVIAARFFIAPGAALPVHKHPYSRMAYVLAGILVVTDQETGQATTYDSGDFIVEMVDRWHFGRNDGAEPVELLVIDMVPQGESNTVVQEN